MAEIDITRPPAVAPLKLDATSLPPDGPKLRLGDLLVSEEVITARQLETALDLQQKTSPRRKLGQILIEERMTSESRIHDAVRKCGSRYRSGELMVLLDLLTPEQLQDCLTHQLAHPGQRIGEIALAKEFVAERQLLLTLSHHFDMAYIEPDANLIDADLLRKLSTQYLRRMEAIPVFSDGKVVTVVTADPTRPEIARDFSASMGLPVDLAVGPRDAILQTIADVEQLQKGGKAVRGRAPDDNIVAIVDYLLSRAVREGASDVHVEPMENRVRVRYRIDGELVHRTDLPIYLATKLASRLKILCKADLSERRKHQGGRILFQAGETSVDMRVSIYVTVHGENIVVRILNRATGVLPMEKLGMLPGLLQRYKENVLDVPTGVVLFTGPTGSGKTTSLYSSVSYCNQPGVKVITAEDPVEYVLDGLVQCQVDPMAGRDFEKTLREIVRQDPNIIVVGEIRDRMTAGIAIEAALTGHKVFATFHTEDSIGSLVRLLDMQIETFLISSTVVCVIAQRLARRICPECRTTAPATAFQIRALGLAPEDAARHVFYRGAGCYKCNQTGYRDRIGLYEMLLIDGPIREMVLAKRSAHEIRHHAVTCADLFSLQEDGIAKALRGWTTLEQVIRHTPRITEQRPLDEIHSIALQEA